MKLMAVDGHSLLIRAVMAGKHRMSQHEIDTGPLLLFINSLSKYVRHHRPTHVVVVWDAGFIYRANLSSKYKANRPPHSGYWMPGYGEDNHTALAYKFCELAGIQNYICEGVEGDDLIANLWDMWDDEMVIVSSDKDMLQLVGESSYQVRPGVDPEVWTKSEVLDYYGCLPERLPLVMALVGDSGDNIEGVKGVGNKTAVSILEQSDWDWDDALAHPKIADSKEKATLALALIDLRRPRHECPIEPAAFFPETRISSDLVAFLEHYALQSVVERLRDMSLWTEVGNRLKR
jgi:DNA polymerase-1